MTIRPARAGAQYFDTATRLTGALCRQFRSLGFEGAIRYVSRSIPEPAGDLTHGELVAILDSGLSLMIVQHVAPAGWTPNPELGVSYGNAAVSNARACGYEPTGTIWLDLEGVRGADAAATIGYINNWARVVAGGGYSPGLYVGPGQPLNAHDLYWRLALRRYWRSAAFVPEVPVRGWQMRQSLPHTVAGIEIDSDVILADALGDVPSIMTKE
jgi:hypothetical protein